MGAGQVQGASPQHGQPLHQHCGHRGLEPAERGHPGDAGGGVRLLQVSSQPLPSPPPFSPLLLPPSPCPVGSAGPAPGILRGLGRRRSCAVRGQQPRGGSGVTPGWSGTGRGAGTSSERWATGLRLLVFFLGKCCKSWLGCVTQR